MAQSRRGPLKINETGLEALPTPPSIGLLSSAFARSRDRIRTISLENVVIFARR